MEQPITTNELLRAADHFVRSGYDITPSGNHRSTVGAFVFDGNIVWAVNKDRHIRTMPLETFVGGVAYALAVEEKILTEEASPENVDELCSYITALFNFDYEVATAHLHDEEF
jgi:hypothetical protein